MRLTASLEFRATAINPFNLYKKSAEQLSSYRPPSCLTTSPEDLDSGNGSAYGGGGGTLKYLRIGQAFSGQKVGFSHVAKGVRNANVGRAGIGTQSWQDSGGTERSSRSIRPGRSSCTVFHKISRLMLK